MRDWLLVTGASETRASSAWPDSHQRHERDIKFELRNWLACFLLLLFQSARLGVNDKNNELAKALARPRAC